MEKEVQASCKRGREKSLKKPLVKSISYCGVKMREFLPVGHAPVAWIHGSIQLVRELRDATYKSAHEY